MTHVLHVDGSGLGWSLDHPQGCDSECPVEKWVLAYADTFGALRPGSWILRVEGEELVDVKPLTGPVVLA